MRPHVTVGGDELPAHELDEGGLSCAVRADEGDAGVEVDAEVEVRVQVLALGVVELDVLEREDGGGRCPGSWNLKLKALSSTGLSVRPAATIFSRTFSLDWACLAFLAVP